MSKSKSDANGADATYEVGHARPPKASRYKPGQSGNLKGRPRGAKGHRAIVKQVLLEKRKVDLHGTGRKRARTMLDIVVLLLKTLAADGDQRAYRTYMDLEKRYGGSDPGEDAWYLLVPQIRDFAEWEKFFSPNSTFKFPD